jgi:2-amino-4-hydroxy-6-hydroxymethyldihydropteridine diphosphokinase
MATPVLVALGSNLGDRLGHLQCALDLLRQRVALKKVSGVYETAPMYVADQPSFYNAALAAEVELSPVELLALLKLTERDVGRGSRERFGPREVDLDLIAYGSLAYTFQAVGAPSLQVPHPKIVERRFVLQPLMDVAPDMVLPGLGSARELLPATNDQAESVLLVRDALLSL